MVNIRNWIKSKTGRLTILSALVLITITIWVSVPKNGNSRKIKRLKIEISPESRTHFVTEQNVSDLITKISGNPIGKSLNDIGVSKIEAGLRKSPYVQSAQVFVTIDGRLKIQIQERMPVLFIQNSQGELYYLDSFGYKMPDRDGGFPDVLVANGNIQEKLNSSIQIKSETLKQVLEVAKFIFYDRFWNSQFEQCYVDNLGDLILIPRIGNHSIVIGTTENLQEKMRNLRVFYEKALRNLGWEQYREINLKYRGQIVAVRHGNQTEHNKNNTVQNLQH